MPRFAPNAAAVVRATVLLVVGAASAALAGCGTGDAAAVAAAVTAEPSASPAGSSNGFTRTEVARGVLSGGGPAAFKPGLETVILDIALEPGASVGWHSHYDGGAFVVKKGVLTNYGLDGPTCKGVDISVGNAYFVPPHAGHPHLARNEGTVPVEATIYYYNVPVGKGTAVKSERPAACPADLN